MSSPETSLPGVQPVVGATNGTGAPPAESETTGHLRVDSVRPRTLPDPRFLTSKDSADVPADLDDPSLYLNRELTLLNFYYRVLHEASDPRTPLLERLRFAAIVSSNVDEFAMKRLGGLKQQIGAGVTDLTVDGRTPEDQVREVTSVLRDLAGRVRAVVREIARELRVEGIELLRLADLSRRERQFIRDYYLQNVHPLVTPQATDPAHPFPFISNLSLNLLVELQDPDSGDRSLARVKVPLAEGTERFVKLPGSYRFVSLERIMIANLDVLFPGMKTVACSVFRVTRNANTDKLEEGADDLLAVIQSELRERRFAPVVRLVVESRTSAEHVHLLMSELGLDQEDVFTADGVLGLRDLMQIANLDVPELRVPPHHPEDQPIFKPDRSMFRTIRDRGSVLVHHPYQSFTTTVERFLREASTDPKVRAIKMTIYRTSEDSNSVRYLMDAARHGKQVSVVVELKASFDEAANIAWANRLEQVGVHVTYGVVGLKTHCKIALVVREDDDGIRTYAHVGTGNYHAGTARAYSDLGLFTARKKTGKDLVELFNYLTTGFKPKRNYKRLLVAPKGLKKAILEKIARETQRQEEGEVGHIQFKLNALEDSDVVRALYQASMAGVRVDLIIRDTCRLRPGIPGLSDHVRVISVLGRFLEHSRIYYFRNGGNEEYYIGSADCMSRNLHSRVEALVPVEGAREQAAIRHMIDLQLEDRRGGWVMRADGSYELRSSTSETDLVSSQVALIEAAEAEVWEAHRLRRRGTRVLRSRNAR